MSKRSRTLLIDGDVLCYKIALTAEFAANWADVGQEDLWTVWANEAETVHRLRASIAALEENLGAERSIVTVTEDTANFRRTFWPDYKQNRAGNRKPLLLSLLRGVLKDSYKALCLPNVEADDLMGILATNGKVSEPVIVSSDKDMKTIPGLHYNLDKPQLGVHEISPETATAFHLMQTLAGDQTDNYPGCPGIGMERAQRIVSELVMAESFEHTFKSGPRKGTMETRWREAEASSAWAAVVAQFHKAGLTEADALVQARCARILTADLWDSKRKEPLLWQPPVPSVG